VESIIRVLVVDDSAFARYSIIRELESDAGIKVVGFARNGLEALEQIKELKPDVVTLDVEMPRLNGIDTLHRVMLEHPTPVIMLSSLTGAGTETTIRALELGAVDFFLKSSQIGPLGDYSSANDLKTKIRVAAGVKVTRVGRPLLEADCTAVPKNICRLPFWLSSICRRDSPGLWQTAWISCQESRLKKLPRETRSEQGRC